MKLRRIPLWIAALALSFAGCRNDEIKVYRVPKEKVEAVAPVPSAVPRLAWKTPAGWEEKSASGIRVASFLVSDPEGSADVSVTVLPGAAGGALANVNRWRGQLGLSPIGAEEMTKLSASLDPNDPTALLVNMAGVDQKRHIPSRLLGAIVPKGGQTWFYKLMGDPPVVEKEKQKFVRFVQTVNYGTP